MEGFAFSWPASSAIVTGTIAGSCGRFPWLSGRGGSFVQPQDHLDQRYALVLRGGRLFMFHMAHRHVI